MQTFLPDFDFVASASILDKKRCFKQTVEALQIWRCLNNYYLKAWKNHPVVKMWRGYENALIEYYNAFFEESLKRGFRIQKMQLMDTIGDIIYPPWLGDDRLHSSHRSNLLRKNFDYYSKFKWKEDSSLPYFWPTL